MYSMRIKIPLRLSHSLSHTHTEQFKIEDQSTWNSILMKYMLRLLSDSFTQLWTMTMAIFIESFFSAGVISIEVQLFLFFSTLNATAIYIMKKGKNFIAITMKVNAAVMCGEGIFIFFAKFITREIIGIVFPSVTLSTLEFISHLKVDRFVLPRTWLIVVIVRIFWKWWEMMEKKFAIDFCELISRVWNLFSFLEVDRWCEKAKNPLITTQNPFKDTFLQMKTFRIFLS